MAMTKSPTSSASLSPGASASRPSASMRSSAMSVPGSLPRISASKRRLSLSVTMTESRCGDDVMIGQDEAPLGVDDHAGAGAMPAPRRGVVGQIEEAAEERVPKQGVVALGSHRRDRDVDHRGGDLPEQRREGRDTIAQRQGRGRRTDGGRRQDATEDDPRGREPSPRRRVVSCVHPACSGGSRPHMRARRGISIGSRPSHTAARVEMRSVIPIHHDRATQESYPA